MANIGVVIVAGGKGKRMGMAQSKQYLPIGGKPIVVHTLEAFERSADVEQIVLVVGMNDIELCHSYVEEHNLHKVKSIVIGGKERQHSVYEGLLQLSTEWVLVHDAVRPFVSDDLITRCCEAVQQHGAVVAAVPVKDTIKLADEQGRITATPDRNRVWAVQTPQAFRREQLISAHRAAFQDDFVGTDDASIAERFDIPVHIVHGEYDNIKITTVDDLRWADYRLQNGKS